MDSTAEVRVLAKGADNATRRTILHSLRDLSLSLETPHDTLQHICYMHTQISTSMSRESSAPLSVDELAEKAGAAPGLLGRVLRYLSSIGTIKETAKDSFTANNITRALAMPAVQSGVYHNFGYIAPAIITLPDLLIKHKYQDITSPTDTPMQIALNTPEPAFIWVQPRPEAHAHFNRFMEIHHSSKPRWFELYPIAETGAGPRPRAGAHCYFLSNIMRNYPDSKAVLILQNIVAAMGPDSVILINDMVLPNSGAHWHVTQVDSAMMTMLAALERTHQQWLELMEKAGLRINRICSPVAGG
ncbi:hypothetical protein BJX68DRAFT_263544 [Aspergillus pseudodeflectus]|uniref:O-methyltransferase C-terminal domain-containing protein n=1 Tax=Aspergillus pseudodeflectus TaxID=176178 RepID=A0ABR4KXR7_9EURO